MRWLQMGWVGGKPGMLGRLDHPDRQESINQICTAF